MKPTNFNEENCESTSSTCVIWDGPTVDCVGICNGDTVTKTVYTLAKQLCTVMDQINISNYDLKCLAVNGCGAPLDFKGLMDLLITKVCANG